MEECVPFSVTDGVEKSDCSICSSGKPCSEAPVPCRKSHLFYCVIKSVRAGEIEPLNFHSLAPLPPSQVRRRPATVKQVLNVRNPHLLPSRTRRAARRNAYVTFQRCPLRFPHEAISDLLSLPPLLSRQDGDGARDLAPCSRGENSGEAKKQKAVGRWSAAES